MLVCQVNTCPWTVHFDMSPIDNDTLNNPYSEDRSAPVDQFAFDTTNLVFDIRKETNSMSSSRESPISCGWRRGRKCNVLGAF